MTNGPQNREEYDQVRTAMAAEQITQTYLLSAYAVVIVITMTFLFQYMYALFVAFLPVTLLYAIQTCPSNDSFDAQRELNRVMKGEHLPEDDPRKPRGLIGRALGTVGAAVGTGLNILAGYEVTITTYMQAFKIATVRLPAMNQECVWIGAFGKWTFSSTRDIPKDRDS